MKPAKKPVARKPKKAYAAPKLANHGDVAKLTRHMMPKLPCAPGSNLFDGHSFKL